MTKRSLLLPALFAAASCLPGAASAALYTTALGSQIASLSDCDDCYSGPYGFGAGHSLSYFGGSYNGLYVGSNGYVTLGEGVSDFVTRPLDTEDLAPMIAALFTDLDSRADDASRVYVNTAQAGQIIVTWSQMGHYDTTYSVRSTFQLVIRSDQFAYAEGEGQVGFFYDTITDDAIASAGFGDGYFPSIPGEVALFLGPASAQSGAAPRWFVLRDGIPDVVGQVPEPGALGLAALGLLGLGLRRRRG